VIIWLASYPRSGNTLLRTIIKRCFGVNSYADEAIHMDSPIRSDSSLVGHEELPTPWDEFYEMATKASDVFLVKTHLPPRDEQPYLYVVRDGRSAIRSYKKYYETYLPDHRASLYQIIAGDDVYGDWSSHYRAWVGRQGPLGMALRFEELTQVSDDLLQRLAAFIGHQGATERWDNPFGALASIEPGFFREGRTEFARDVEWGELVDAFFYFFHARLHEELGYSPGKTPRSAPEWQALFQWNQELVGRHRELRIACDERLVLIKRLSVEAERRLDVINSMVQQGESGRLRRLLKWVAEMRTPSGPDHPV